MIKTTYLHNGVRIVTEKISNVHSVSIGIWVKAGSRNETPQENGIAHFIEHMLFKGTRRYSAAEIARMIDSVGGVLNAFTTKEYTCFYVKVLHQHFKLAIDLLCDIFFDSVFDQEEVEKERNVIMQEIHMIKDTPDDYVQDLFNQCYFHDHPLGYSILGELETVQNFKKTDIFNFFDREYCIGDRIIISAAGNIKHRDILEAIAPSFERLEKKDLQTEHSPFVPARCVSFNKRELEQVHICLGTAGISQNDPRRYALYLLNAILGGSMSSRLFQEIRENYGLAYSIFSFTMSFYDTGLFGVYLGVRSKTVKEALHIVHKEIRALKDTEVDAEELHNAKEQLKGNMLLSLESTDSRMSRLAKCELYHGGYIPLEDIVQGIDAVTADAVRELSRQMFKDELFTYTFLGPVTENDLQPQKLALG